MSVNDKRMSGKQDLVAGFDLDAFVGGAEPAPDAAPAPAPQPAPAAPRARAKPKKELLSQRVQVRMTDAEFARLEKAAGMVPISIYLRHFLQEKGLI